MGGARSTARRRGEQPLKRLPPHGRVRELPRRGDGFRTSVPEPLAVLVERQPVALFLGVPVEVLAAEERQRADPPERAARSRRSGAAPSPGRPQPRRPGRRRARASRRASRRSRQGRGVRRPRSRGPGVGHARSGTVWKRAGSRRSRGLVPRSVSRPLGARILSSGARERATPKRGGVGWEKVSAGVRNRQRIRERRPTALGPTRSHAKATPGGRGCEGSDRLDRQTLSRGCGGGRTGRRRRHQATSSSPARARAWRRCGGR